MKKFIRFFAVIFALTVIAGPVYSATRPSARSNTTVAQKNTKTNNTKNTKNNTAKNDTKKRAATNQKVINIGTKVQESTAKSSSCQEKYEACMDAGCIIDNDSGGRCQCSNKITELNAKLDKIKKKDIQSQRMLEATESVLDEQKYGSDIIQSDFSDADDDVDDLDSDSVTYDSVGDKLRSEMHKLCMERIPECKAQVNLISNMYTQKIKSDCAAFENALVEQQHASQDRRAEVKKSVRAAALEQYNETNKYDLGQCVIEFTSCMQKDAECGKDFTGCVGTVAKDKIYAGETATVAVSGPNASIMIAQSTMDVLDSKKYICERVLDSCVSVKDQVWDMFLRNSVADIKLAELTAESNVRTSCLDNISNCFVKACKENIDGNDSYDMCLTRPESMKSFCKVEMEPCLAATGGSYDNPEASTLWPSVLAKLSAMRVDSCTEEIKTCMQSDDRCGSDYSKCIGLDTNIIMRMCPYDKLTGCEKVYGAEAVKGEAIYDEVAQIIEGVILNIDNEMLQTCENAVDRAMDEVCAGETCQSFAVAPHVGADALNYSVCQYTTDSPDSTEGFKWFDCRADIDHISDAELGRVHGSQDGEMGPVKPFAGVITGVIKWEFVEINDEGYVDIDKYMDELTKEKISDEEKNRVRSTLEQLQGDINRVITSVEQDQWVQFCINGREIEGVTDKFGKNKVRFPKMANTIRRQMATTALNQARNNYYAKYDELTDRMQQDLVKISERLAKIADANQHDVEITVAREACVNMAALSAFAKAPVGQSLWAKILIGIIVVAAIVVATVFTCGAAAGVAGGVIGSFMAANGAVLASGAAAGAAAATASATASLAAISGSLATSAALTAGMGAATAATIGASAAATSAAIAASAAAASAAAATAAVGAAVGAGIGVATAGAMIATGVALSEESYIKQENANMMIGQENQKVNNHGEYFANEWNYREKITTDFDEETMKCKKCISHMKCKKTAWHIFSDRNCKKWETEDFVDERCTETQF